MEAVVHAGRKPQCNVLAITIEVDELWVDEQVLQSVWESLNLNQLVAIDPSTGADDSVRRAREDLRVAIDRAGAGLELSRETRMQARKMLHSRFAQVEVGKQPPDRD